MTVEEIKKKKRVGDNELVASLVGISAGNVTMVFRERPTSKRYAEIIEAFTFVIQTHEKMIREYRDKKEKENSDNL